ncbi:AAA-like domain-containing protein [Planktothrix paucivesiculata]|uniref:Uncharacterized protein n=1 Tax=Planktothrix paucivesiculata PCC 9631 TaxID=671071 RepID=A0A7Z9BL24_9CYAN|nr:AAA-like domain-containing protein [Planktothrix paucivesiculata]VXD15040.1 hypothetical protein PL9631_1100082 [Planktothrix paucivesiculata PCC 9631]
MAEASPNFSYQVGGSLPVNSPTYIYRQADEQFYQGLKAGEFCYVLNSRQMGKSSLRVQTMQRLQAENIVCAAIDLTAIGTSDITAEEWYAGLIDSIVSSLNLYDDFDLDEWWTKNQRLSNVRRWNKFIESILLSAIDQKIVIFIDEIDSILRLNFNVDDFFASIRACYNKRAEQPDFNRLTFALLGVATPNDLINSQYHSTPFNIGQAIELTGFQFQEAKPLALGFIQKSANPEIVLQEVLNWTGGQPFLTQKVCQLVRLSEEIIPEGEEKKWVEKLVRSRIIENWEVQDEPEHLRTIRDRLLWESERSEELLELYSQILTSESTLCKETKEYLELRLTGIVIKSKEKVAICNYIYLEIFNLSWLENLGIITKKEFLSTIYKNVFKISQIDLFKNLSSPEIIQIINNSKLLKDISFNPTTLPNHIEMGIQKFQKAYANQDINLLNSLISKNFSGSLCGSISKSTLIDFYKNFFIYFPPESNLRLIVDKIYILDESELFLRLIVSFVLKGYNRDRQWFSNQFDSGDFYIEIGFEPANKHWEILRLDKVYWQAKKFINDGDWFNPNLHL